MHDHERHETGDDFHAELSNVEPAAGAINTSLLPSPSPLESRRTRRQRIAWLAATGLIVVTLTVILSSAANLPGHFAALVAHPTPTATFLPPFSVDQVYLLPNPPGVDVTLDGRLLTRLPLPGDPHPLRLSRGAHIFAWRSHLFPFRPLQCRISVPHDSGDTCQFVSRQFLPGSLSALPGAVIATHVSMAALYPDGSGVPALIAAIQAALAAHSSTAIIHPGERYFAPDNYCCTTVVARQPLRATLTYQYVSNAGYPEPCVLIQPAIPCRFAGQDCAQICTVAQPPAAIADTPNTWVAAALVSGEWTYATLDGRVIGANIPNQFGLQVAVLRITWDGAWHVSPIFGHTLGLDVADAAACDPLLYAISQTPSWSYMLNDPPPGAQVYVASDATPADGCVGVLSRGQGIGATAVFLLRFGALLTVNDTARNPVDHLPAADAAEQRLAQHLLAELPACAGVTPCPTSIPGAASVPGAPAGIRAYSGSHR